MARKIRIPMEDPIIHTVDNPVCQEPGCCCRDLEYAQLIEDMKPKKTKRNHTVLVERNYETAPLNYRNRGFQILK